MKFPVVFRIFASLNLIGFLLLFIQSVVLALSPTNSTWLLVISCLTTVWVLIFSIFWFFASARSYSLLLLNAVILWFMAGSMLYWGFVQKAVTTSGDKIAFLIYGCICFIYSIFLLVSLGFKPVREWCRAQQATLFDIRISTAFVITLAAGVGISYYLDVLAKKYIVLETIQPSQKISETEYYIDLNALTELDGLALLSKNNVKEFEAMIYFSDSYNSQADTEFSSSRKVTFRTLSLDKLREGESLSATSTSDVYLYTDFPLTSARRLLIRTTTPVLAGIEENFTTLHSVPLFDKSTSASQFFTYNEEVYDEPDYDGDYYEPEPEFIVLEEPDGTPEELDHSWAVRLVNQFKNDLINRNDWYYFNRTVTTITIDGVAIGHYLNFRSILEYVPQSLNQIIADYNNQQEVTNYDLNSGVRKLTGLNLFTNYGDPEDKFRYVNPKTVAWVQKNLVLLGGDIIGDVDVKEVYDKMFKRMFWQMAAAHEYLNHDGYFEQEAEAYKVAMENPEFRGTDYLWERFKNVNEDSEYFALVKQNNPKVEDDYYYFDEQVAIGFWLRRKIDGSEPALWELVKEVIKTYDNAPFPTR